MRTDHVCKKCGARMIITDRNTRRFDQAVKDIRKENQLNEKEKENGISNSNSYR